MPEVKIPGKYGRWTTNDDLNPKRMPYVQICKLIKTAPHNFVQLTYMSWSEKSFYFKMVIPTVDRDFGLANETI